MNILVFVIMATEKCMLYILDMINSIYIMKCICQMTDFYESRIEYSFLLCFKNILLRSMHQIITKNSSHIDVSCGFLNFLFLFFGNGDRVLLFSSLESDCTTIDFLGEFGTSLQFKEPLQYSIVRQFIFELLW